MKGTFVTIFFYFLALAYAATVPDSASKDTLEARDKPTKAIIPTQLPDGRHRFDLHDNDVYVGAVEEDAHEAEGFVVYGPKGDVIKMPEQHKRSGVYSRQLPIPPFLQKFADAIWRNGLRLLVNSFLEPFALFAMKPFAGPDLWLFWLTMMMSQRILNCIPPDVLRTCSVQVSSVLVSITSWWCKITE